MKHFALLALFVAPMIGQTVTDPNLQVTTVASSLTTPIGMIFLGPGDFLVAEKLSGQVKRVTGGVVAGAPVLDLPVNFASERGLLSIARHPNFNVNGFVYLFWTQSSTAADSGVLSEVPLLGNRVDRYFWNGSLLTFDRNIVLLRSRQNDATNGIERGNHNGGPIRFGTDGLLYILMGDQGRRGWMQNLPNGPFVAGGPDDQFGGPAPDDAHLSGVILRLNDDGTAPAGNPFFAAGASMGGEVGANIQKVFSYGHRNGFGLAVDPANGNVWDSENGDDSFDEINRIVAGGNYGWIQAMGPISRLAQFKQIETTMFNSNLQQVRYPPTRIAYAPALAMSRLFSLPGSAYQDPQMSWKYAVSPAGMGFVVGNGLGASNNGTLWMGAATPVLSGGYLMRFTLNAPRTQLVLGGALADGVADNSAKYDPTESTGLIVGQDFGVSTDIQTGPDGALYVVSLTNGAVYRIALAVVAV